MNKILKPKYHKLLGEQKGEMVLIALAFMLLGFLMIVPLVSFMSTGLKTGMVYNNKTADLYAADAGIEDSKWQIEFDQLTGKFSTYNPPYDPHDFINVWQYSLPQLNNQPQINNKNVNIKINNVWIPKGITAPDKATANSIINNSKLMITGGPYGTYSYNVVITYNPGINENLKIKAIGIWLPPGYTYKSGSNNLGSEPATTAYQGGQAVIWDFSANPVLFTSLPGVRLTDSPMTAKITFDYNPSTTVATNAGVAGSSTLNVGTTSGFPNAGSLTLQGEPSAVTYTGKNATAFTGIPATGTGAMTLTHAIGEPVGITAKPDAVSWVNTSNVSGLSYTWDDTVRVFHITSTADNTSVETYIAKSELRKMGGASNGDYYATGNSLMRDLDSDGVKETRVNSSAIVAAPNPAGADNGVPDDANVSASYLYWGTWYISDYWAQNWNVSNSNRCHTLFYDDCSRFNDGGTPPTYYWDNGSDWSVRSSSRFRAYGNNDADTSPNRDLIKHSSFAFDLGTYPSPSWVFTLSWEQWYSGTTPGTGDGLDFSISNDGGTTWSNPIQAFRGSGVGSTGTTVSSCYQYIIPATYLTSNFKIKFHVVGFNLSNQYVNIDDIRINALNPNTGITFKINNGSGDKIVYFDSNGNPATSTDPANKVISNHTQVILTYSFGGSNPQFTGFAESCFRDVTALVQKYAAQPVPPATNYNGHATYSAVGDLGDTGNNSSAYQLAHAGWSLVTIFTGPETLGHQLYLYDNFFGSGNDSGGIHVVWNGDGSSGGTIKGFVVPQQIQGEVNAAKLTCFVTEGDNQLTGDYIKLNGTQLWDGTNSTSNSKSSPNNVWNSSSYLSGGYSIYDGVDIDTLGVDPTANPPQYITWSSGILKPGDTSANIDLYTQQDYWFMVYMIISFRSDTTTGGSLSYLIHG